MLFVHGLFCCCGAGLVVEARGRFMARDGQKNPQKSAIWLLHFQLSAERRRGRKQASTRAHTHGSNRFWWGRAPAGSAREQPNPAAYSCA
jgi:ribosomal protein L4